MANEFKHKDPGSALTQAEYISASGCGHIFACQATGDILYASSATVLKNLGKGAANTVLSMGGSCIPAWTASPSVTDLTIGGGCITLSAATDIDLLDNNASALSFDSTGKTGIIDIVTTNCSEGVTMSGTLGVTGLLTAGSLDVDDVLISGTTIGHTCDSDLLTLGNATLLAKGTVTVGVCGTGHDVKFFGCEAGAYMLYDESEEQLEIRGAAADAATSTGKLLLSTALTNINACDVIGSINFQAPAEAGGTDAVAIAAGIRAVAQATFTCAVNATDLIFYTGHSEAAAERFRFTSQNEIGIAGANYGTDGQVLTSGGAGAAVAWEDAAGGCVLCDTSPQLGGNLDMQARLLVGNGGSTGIAISSDGEVNMAAQPAFRVTPDATNNVTGDGTNYCVKFANEIFDVGANVACASCVTTFTAPVAGKYLLTWSPRLTSNASGHTAYTMRMITTDITFYKSGNAFNEQGVGGCVTLQPAFAVIANMSACHTAKVQVDITGGAKTVDLDANSTWSGMLLG
jgi:hypothetical protein